MADVFISYAREDRVRADQIARGLQAIGLECFWDTEIPPGQTWADYIEGKLSQCKVVIVLWSAHSTASQWVREEARMGRDAGKLIPVSLDASPPPFGFGEVQAANLSGWNGDTGHADWLRFANAVHGSAKGAPAPTPRARPAFAPPPASASAGGATPWGYVLNCLRRYADGKGRARRAEYGWFLVFSVVALVLGAMLDVETFGFNPYSGELNAAIFTALVVLGLVCPSVAAASRRAHDFGQSGWLAALTAIPYLGFIPALVLVFVPGNAGPNQYGPDPKASA